jgi:hypothetical protein
MTKGTKLYIAGGQWCVTAVVVMVMVRQGKAKKKMK